MSYMYINVKANIGWWYWGVVLLMHLTHIYIYMVNVHNLCQLYGILWAILSLVIILVYAFCPHSTHTQLLSDGTKKNWYENDQQTNVWYWITQNNVTPSIPCTSIYINVHIFRYCLNYVPRVSLWFYSYTLHNLLNSFNGF